MSFTDWTQAVAIAGVWSVLSAQSGTPQDGAFSNAACWHVANSASAQAMLLRGSALSAGTWSWTHVARGINNGNGDAGVAFMVNNADVSNGTYYSFRIQNYTNNYILAKRLNGSEAGTIVAYANGGAPSAASLTTTCRVDWIADSVRFGGTYIRVQVGAPSPFTLEVIDIATPILVPGGQGLLFIGTGGGGIPDVSSNIWQNVTLASLSAVAPSVT